MQDLLPVLYPCPSYPGWYATAEGRVWSERGKHKPRWIRPSRHTLGYRYTKYARPDGRMQMVYIHQVVADAFFGPCPKGCEVNHKDCDKANNRPENLEYVTRRQNMHHYARTKGYAMPKAKLEGFCLPKNLIDHTPNPRLSRILDIVLIYPPKLPDKLSDSP